MSYEESKSRVDRSTIGGKDEKKEIKQRRKRREKSRGGGANLGEMIENFNEEKEGILVVRVG